MSPVVAQTMRGRRSKALLLAAALLVLAAFMQLGVGAPATGPAGATTQPAGTTTRPGSGGPPALKQADANTIVAPLGRQDSNSPFKWTKLGDETSPMWQMIGMVVVIGVLGLLALWMVRRMRSGMAHRHGRNISVLETACLGPHKSVHLLRVGQKEFLVASTRERISMLADVTDGADSTAVEEPVEDQS